jgi:Uma2 family endonuclease
MASYPTPETTAFEPTWAIAHLYPLQGTWSEEEYLDLTDSTNKLVEYTAGRIEVLEMPTTSHQMIVMFLLDSLRGFVVPRELGTILFAPLRIQVGRGKFREPDIVFALAKNSDKVEDRYWNGADLVVEVVSLDKESRERDYEKKRTDYAAAGIAEYWIVDPAESRITVLTLDGESYTVHGEFHAGDAATSVLLESFSVDVTSVFAAAKA